MLTYIGQISLDCAHFSMLRLIGDVRMQHLKRAGFYRKTHHFMCLTLDTKNPDQNQSNCRKVNNTDMEKSTALIREPDSVRKNLSNQWYITTLVHDNIHRHSLIPCAGTC